MKKYVRFAAMLSFAATFALFTTGCSQQTTKPQDSSVSGANSNQQASQTPNGSEERIDSTPSNQSHFAILEGRTTGPMLPIYFDFDKSGIKADQKNQLEKNAKYMKSAGSARFVIQGNCDERGTNEYNMALGERRALGAKKYLINLGVASSKLTTVSYGEEKPVNHGHDELAWSQNRRDDFVQVQ